MRQLSVLVLSILAALALLAPASCGDDEWDCVGACEDAQARDCTSITGDCGDFCDALFNVEEPSGCVDERSDYQGCLDDQGVCGGSCGASENALESCVGTYCLAHSGDADCQVLVNSF